MLTRIVKITTKQMFFLGLLIATFVEPLRAEEVESDKEVQIDLGPGVVMGPWSLVCEKDYDVVLCGSPTLLPDLTLGARYRSGGLALGGIVAIGRLYSSDVMKATMWRAAIEGRYYNHLGEVLDHWFALELGVVGAHSKTDTWSPYEGDTGVDKENELGPEIGAGMGLDFQMGKYFAMGFSMRVNWLIFFELEGTDQWDDSLILYKTLWFTMGAHLRFSFPL